MTKNSIAVAITWLPAALVLQALAVQAVASPGREEITPAEVASAIDAAGVQVTPQQVILLGEVVARNQAPALKVESMEQWGRHRLKVRLNCAVAQQCLPFYAAVSLAPTQDVLGVTQTFQPISPLPARNVEAKAPVAVRAGASSVLLLDGIHIHIRLLVTCLESGYVGQTIRVVEKGRHSYVAEIDSDGFLRGRL